ncbi:hypothetical protein AA102526_0773 [Asaia lannensis NBRC 102526]|nr:hypothetical protein AA102526_0773 [Asaia lannensis NBRC 102526]
MTGRVDDRKRWAMCPAFLAQLGTVTVGQGDIHDHDVNRFIAMDEPARRLARIGLKNPNIAVLKELDQA